MPRLTTDFDTRICGIPCSIKVLSYTHVPPWRGDARTAPSDLDYYGYTEWDFIVCDRKGYIANWLQAKLTDDIEATLLKEYEETLNG